MTGQEETASNWIRVCVDQALGRHSLLWRQWHTGTGCSLKLWLPHLWRHSRPGWMEPWQPGPVKGIPAHGRGLGSKRSVTFLPSQTMLWFSFCDFVTPSVEAHRTKIATEICESWVLLTFCKWLNFALISLCWFLCYCLLAGLLNNNIFT